MCILDIYYEIRAFSARSRNCQTSPPKQSLTQACSRTCGSQAEPATKPITAAWCSSTKESAVTPPCAVFTGCPGVQFPWDGLQSSHV